MVMASDTSSRTAGSSALHGGDLQGNTDRIERLIESLSSLHGIEKTVVQLILYGRAAVPALHAFLFTRDPSGIYEPRCWAVRALARIGAHDVLVEFLNAEHEVSDPVGQLGEEAVMNTAARALAGVVSEEAYQALLKVAQWHPLAGAIEVLGEFRREEVVPLLVGALEDDVARAAATDALRRFGARVGSALRDAAVRRVPTESESPSSVRRRRSALRLLTEMALAHGFWRQLQDLIDDPNDAIAATACMAAIECGTEPQKQRAIQTLIRLLDTSDWLLRSEIERSLARNFEISRSAICEALARDPAAIPLRARRTLARLLARGTAQHHA
jgi:HEAT repeat protein